VRVGIEQLGARRAGETQLRSPHRGAVGEGQREHVRREVERAAAPTVVEADGPQRAARRAPGHRQGVVREDQIVVTAEDPERQQLRAQCSCGEPDRRPAHELAPADAPPRRHPLRLHPAR